MADDFVYKWIPADVVSNWLRYGISFSPASNFRGDPTEFTLRYRPLQEKEIIPYLEENLAKYPWAKKALLFFKNKKAGKAKKKRKLGMLNDLFQKEYQEMVTKGLMEKFYVCCMTQSCSMSFGWSEQKNVDYVCLKFDYSALKRHYRTSIRPVIYKKYRPAANQTDNLIKKAYDIMFCKLRSLNRRNFESEKEVRIIVCKDELDCNLLNVLDDSCSPGGYIYDKTIQNYLLEIIVPKSISKGQIDEWKAILETKNNPETALSYWDGLRPLSKNEYVAWIETLTGAQSRQGEFPSLGERGDKIFMAFQKMEIMYPACVVEQIFDCLTRDSGDNAELFRLFEKPRYLSSVVLRSM